MNLNELEILIEKSSGTDIVHLLSIKEKAKRAANEEPTPANIAALEKVSKMLEYAMINKPNQKNNDDFPKIKTIAEVVNYLNSCNRKAKKSKVAEDIKRGTGGLRKNSDLTFSKKVLDDYASTLPLIAIDEAKAEEVSDLGKKKLEAEIARIQENTKSIAFDRAVREGKYIARTEVELELASRAVALGIGIKSVFELKASELVSCVVGDNNKTIEFIHNFEQILDEALNEYSKPIRFEIDFSENTIENIEEVTKYAEEQEDQS